MIVDAHAVEFSKTAVPLWGGHPRRSAFRPYAQGRSAGRPRSIAHRTNRCKPPVCRGRAVARSAASAQRHRPARCRVPTGPKRLLAATSQLCRFDLFFPSCFRHTFNAFWSFCDLVRAFTFAQPVTPILVVSWISAPFWAMNSVGIASFWVQRLPFARQGAEYGPSGASVRRCEGDVGDRLERCARDPRLC